MKKQLNLKHLIFPLIFKLLKLSLLGIYHTQLRSRHILVNHSNEICIIDFGNSLQTNSFNALFKNFGFVKYNKSKFLYVLKQIVNYKDVEKKENFLMKNEFGRYFQFQKYTHLNKMNESQICFYINELMRSR